MNTKNIFILAFLTISSISFGQTFCLSFGNPKITEGGTKFEFDIFIQKTGSDFNLGSSNLVFDFNNSGIATPTLVSHTLTGSYDVPTVTNPLPNRASFNVVLNNDNNGKAVNDTPTLLGRVKFNIINATMMSGINWLYSGGTTKTVVHNDKFPNNSQLFATDPTTGCLQPLNAPLPVSLVDFTAQGKDKSILLEWVTESQKNFSHFDLQRSIDGVSFSSIAKIVSNDKGGKSSYIYDDTEVNTSVRYFYRLNMIDLDGRAEFSQIRSAIINEKGGVVRVSPNPVGKDMNITVTTDKEANYKFILIDVNGKVVKTSQFTKETTIEVIGLPTGTYIYRIENGSELKTGKLIIGL